MTVMINEFRYKSKPSSTDASLINMNMNIATMNEKQFRSCVLSGMSFRPGIYEDNKLCDGHWLGQQVFCVDVDNDKSRRTVKENIELCKKYGLEPCFIYCTFGGNFENRRHRIVFLMRCMVDDMIVRDEIQRKLNEMFSGDMATENASRFFYGGKIPYFIGINSRITKDEIDLAYERWEKANG